MDALAQVLTVVVSVGSVVAFNFLNFATKNELQSLREELNEELHDLKSDMDKRLERIENKIDRLIERKE